MSEPITREEMYLAALGRTYTETDEPVDVVELSETEEKARAYDILAGVSG